MNEMDLKRYAMIGLIVRIAAEKEKLKKIIDKTQKQQIENRIEKMEREYNILFDETTKI